MVHIEPRFYFFGALLLLVLPLPWVGAAILAAGVHELCHLGAVYLLGGNVLEIRLDVGGAQIHAELPGRAASIAASLAGPVGSLLLLLLCHRIPRTAICGFTQGIYNLLPLRTLDGGRALGKLLEATCPEQAQKVMEIVETVTVFLLTLAVLYGCRILSLNFWPIILIPACHWGISRRKIPCKQGKIRVQ